MRERVELVPGLCEQAASQHRPQQQLPGWGYGRPAALVEVACRRGTRDLPGRCEQAPSSPSRDLHGFPRLSCTLPAGCAASSGLTCRAGASQITWGLLGARHSPTQQAGGAADALAGTTHSAGLAHESLCGRKRGPLDHGSFESSNAQLPREEHNAFVWVRQIMHRGMLEWPSTGLNDFEAPMLLWCAAVACLGTSANGTHGSHKSRLFRITEVRLLHQQKMRLHVVHSAHRHVSRALTAAGAL